MYEKGILNMDLLSLKGNQLSNLKIVIFFYRFHCFHFFILFNKTRQTTKNAIFKDSVFIVCISLYWNVYFFPFYDHLFKNTFDLFTWKLVSCQCFNHSKEGNISLYYTYSRIVLELAILILSMFLFFFCQGLFKKTFVIS